MNSNLIINNSRFGAKITHNCVDCEHASCMANRDAIKELIRSKKITSGVVFLDDDPDIFDSKNTFEFIEVVFAVAALRPDVEFKIVTRNPKTALDFLRWENACVRIYRRACDWLAHYDGDPIGSGELWENAYWIAKANSIRIDTNQSNMAAYGYGWKMPLPNVWLGVIIEDQSQADEKIPILLECPVVAKFLVCDRLTGPIDLTKVVFSGGDHLGKSKHFHNFGYDSWIDLVVVAKESSINDCQQKVNWTRSIVNDCKMTNVPVFFK